MIEDTLEKRLAAVRSRIADACVSAGRPADSVTLVAVSKTVDVARVAQAVAAGQRDFGENYVQEALAKIAAVPGPIWHFLGPIQSNKTADIAANFDWVHGVDRDKIARRLSEQRPASLAPLNVCVQVNISNEDSKSGVAPGDALALCRTVAALPRLKLRGLMAIPKKGVSPPCALRELYESIRAEGLVLDTISAGMSDDYEHAIAEGSTIVRVGTAIFGPRL